MTRRAAGVLVRARSTGRVLFLLRRDCECWGTPGGHLERGEDELAGAIRELWEETHCELVRSFSEAPVRHGGYALFYCEVAYQFRPVLNDEHSDFAWACPENPPHPLHPGLQYQMKRLGVV